MPRSPVLLPGPLSDLGTTTCPCCDWDTSTYGIVLRDCRPLRGEERSLVMQVAVTQQNARSFHLLSAPLFSPSVAQRMQK